jgi:hypothetical protein
LSWGARILILETLLHFCHLQCTLIIQAKINSAVTQKKSKHNICLTFVSRKKLQRFVCALSSQLTGFLLEEPDLGLDRIGSQTEENFIGSVRSICLGDNRLDNVQHQVAQSRDDLPCSIIWSPCGLHCRLAAPIGEPGDSTFFVNIIVSDLPTYHAQEQDERS